MSVPLHETSITTLTGVGPSLASKLSKLSIETLQDLLFHLPYRYQDRTRSTPLKYLRMGEYALICADIISSQVMYGKRRSLLVHLADKQGKLTLRFFHFNKQQLTSLSEKGSRISCFGEVRFGRHGLEMIHPEYQLLKPDQPVKVSEHLTPIYATTDGVSQHILRKLINQALNYLKRHALEDLLPSSLMSQHDLPSINDAVMYLHAPPPDANLNLLESGQHPAQKRLILEELLAHQLSYIQLREQMQQFSAASLRANHTLIPKFLSALPFELTGAQKRVNNEIQADLEKGMPMMRLVQGDVGAGKTVVAAMALLSAVENKTQSALMAPTEILAEQHYQSLLKWFSPLNIQVGWLSGKLAKKIKDETIAQLKAGAFDVVVGTHALFQTDVMFDNLSLVVIDEQHRFGVHQRLALRNKGKQHNHCPHQLIMTATPIPRTLAMTAFADLDLSVLDELPPGRQPITTIAVPSSRRDEVVERVKVNCAKGQQAYWVCTLIEESESLQCEAAEKTASYLREVLPELSIGLIHGRLKSDEKENIMEQFKAKQIDLLVATTVIEVGVDVPNATLMVIENPERLGLAQLHQLRGRIGRGLKASHCVLMYQPPLSEHAKKRLHIMRNTQDGFEIAREDLKMRGPGEVLGTQQTGLHRYKVADLARDENHLQEVQDVARNFVKTADTKLVKGLIRRWMHKKLVYRMA